MLPEVISGRLGHVFAIPVRDPGVVHVAGEEHPHSLRVEIVAATGEEILVEPHEELDLLVRTRPVLGGEGEGGQPLDADLQGSFDRVEQRRLTGGMPRSPGQATGIGPSPIPVEDQPDMPRDAVRVDPGDIQGHSITASEMSLRSRWYSTKRRAMPIASPARLTSVSGIPPNSAWARAAR